MRSISFHIFKDFSRDGEFWIFLRVLFYFYLCVRICVCTCAVCARAHRVQRDLSSWNFSLRQLCCLGRVLRTKLLCSGIVAISPLLSSGFSWQFFPLYLVISCLFICLFVCFACLFFGKRSNIFFCTKIASFCHRLLLWWQGGSPFSYPETWGRGQNSQPTHVRRGQRDSLQLMAAFGTPGEQLWRVVWGVDTGPAGSGISPRKPGSRSQGSHLHPLCSLKKIWLLHPLCDLRRLQNGLHLFPWWEPPKLYYMKL